MDTCYICGKMAAGSLNMTINAASGTPSVFKPICQDHMKTRGEVAGRQGSEPELLTSDEIDAIEARAKAATPGPWVVRGGPDEVFAAYARTDIPRLTATVRQLQREMESAKRHDPEALLQEEGL